MGAKKEPAPAKLEQEIKQGSLEAVTAQSAVALFYAVEQLVRARNPEAAAILFKLRGELERAIAAKGE